MEVRTVATRKPKKWIGPAIKRPGALRRKLHVKKGQKIPAAKLEAAAKKPGLIGEEARLAIRMRGFKHGGRRKKK